VIPLSGAGHLRVPHPFATLLGPPPEGFRPFAFDLHVLGTPPAFILSQDQTLRKGSHPSPLPGDGYRLSRSDLAVLYCGGRSSFLDLLPLRLLRYILPPAE